MYPSDCFSSFAVRLLNSKNKNSIIFLIFILILQYFAELRHNNRRGKTTIANVDWQVCSIIWNKLESICMPSMTENKWKEISEIFLKYSNFSHRLVAIDYKHDRIVQPHDSGFLFHNYKQFFSTNLLAVCDANYCFFVRRRRALW